MGQRSWQRESLEAHPYWSPSPPLEHNRPGLTPFYRKGKWSPESQSPRFRAGLDSSSPDTQCSHPPTTAIPTNDPTFSSSPIKTKSSANPPRQVVSPGIGLLSKHKWSGSVLSPIQASRVARLAAPSSPTSREGHRRGLKKFFPQKYRATPEGGSSGSVKKEENQKPSHSR